MDSEPHWWTKMARKLNLVNRSQWNKWNQWRRGSEESFKKTSERVPTPVPAGFVSAATKASVHAPVSGPPGLVEATRKWKGKWKDDKKQQRQEEEINAESQKDVFRFTELPRELRDEVYRHLFICKHPIALSGSQILCASHCGLIVDRHLTRLPVQVLLTCRQIHDEGQLVMYHDNSWALQPGACAGDPQTSILLHNKHLFDSFKRHKSARDIRFLDFSIHLAPIVDRYVTRGEILSHRNTSSWNWLRQIYPESGNIFIAFTEADECARLQLVLNHLALFQRYHFPQLQSIAISLTIHEQGSEEDRHCDLRLKILIKLHHRDRRYIPIRTRDIKVYEPRRQFLTPLALLDNLQSVVVRFQPRQTSGTRTSPAENKTVAPPKKQQPKAQPPPIWTFTSIKTMLDTAGLGFENFRPKKIVPATEVESGPVAALGLGVWLGA